MKIVEEKIKNNLSRNKKEQKSKKKKDKRKEWKTNLPQKWNDCRIMHNLFFQRKKEEQKEFKRHE